MRSNFVQLLSLVMFLMNAPCFCEGLKCYACHSTISWEECEKNIKIFDCDPAADEVCVTQYQVEHAGSEGGYKEMFSKFCAKAESCTNKHCIKDGKNCDNKCCHEDLCNTAETRTPRAVFVIMNLLLVNFALMSISPTYFRL